MLINEIGQKRFRDGDGFGWRAAVDLLKKAASLWCAAWRLSGCSRKQNGNGRSRTTDVEVKIKGFCAAPPLTMKRRGLPAS
ncbi:MAG: hypothetical protein H6669_13575 [Ardenticatenaceae bacterium]|nr:hypothetical protein [Ardenticatenaceae bacterium]